MFEALLCPQCGAALPRQARWRMVACPYCKATVTWSKQLVQAADFHAAWLRGRNLDDVAGPLLSVAAQAYQLEGCLGGGPHAEVWLARRLAPGGGLVVLKRARNESAEMRLRTEHTNLLALQEIEAPGAAYFSQRLPQAEMIGDAVQVGQPRRLALVLRHPAGFWGSLADAHRHAPQGFDPRHVVWIWRRALEVLAYLHTNGWAHGDLANEQLLVHPRNHGVMLIGWAHARPAREAAHRDLHQLAWSMRSLLSAPTQDAPPAIPPRAPVALAALLRQCTEDPAWAARQGASGLEQALVGAAHRDFGSPRFIEFNPLAPGASL